MILVLGGTSDSIEICNLLNKHNLSYFVSVTTAYGKEIASKCTDKVLLKKLTIEDMIEFIKENKIDKVIDATHPYAVEVSTNAMKACELSSTRYIRFERESLINQINYDNKYLVETVEEACEVANKVGNNIFIGTGSKNLSIYKELIKNKNLITRVLPTSEVLISCENLGFNADNIIAMKGPFTQEMNESTYKQYYIDLVITKESGIAGGFLEKVNACKTLNIPVVIIKRKEMNYPNTIGNIEKLIDLINIY